MKNRYRTRYQNQTEPKVIQLLPLPAGQKVAAVFDNEDGTVCRVVCSLIALYSDGDMQIVTIDEDGVFSEPAEMSNFLRFEYEYQ